MELLTTTYNEADRLNELWNYNILDTLTEKDYEDITFMASIICDVPISLISFVDKNRQWFKSHKGLELSETSREYSFCAHALNLPGGSLIIPDSRKDERFYDNPFVTGDPNIVFYAGFPLVSSNGFGLGSLCVIDNKPRELSNNQLSALQILASQVMNLLEMRKSNTSLQQTKKELEARNKELELSTQKLAESETHMKTMSQGMDVLLAIGDTTGNVVHFTDAWSILTGKSVEKLIDFGWSNLLHPEDRDKYVKTYMDAFQKKESFKDEFRILDRTGNYTWLLSQGSPQILADGTFMGYISSSINITELKKAELELTKTAKRLQLALEAGKLCSYELDLKSGVITTSDQCKKEFGLTMEGEVKLQAIRDMIFPKDLPFVERSFDYSIKNNVVYDAQYRVVFPDGEMRWIHASGLPVYDENGTAIQMAGVAVDVTAQKIFESELERQVAERTKELEEKNLDLDRMNQELQSFAYISSHDLQEPLRKIQAFSLFILEKERERLSEKGKDYFMRIQHSADRMQILINDLLAYSRTVTSETTFVETDMYELVNELKDDLSEEIRAKNATIQIGDMHRIKIIPFQFRQLLQNLFTNSLKFSRIGLHPIINITSTIAKGKELGYKKLLDDETYCHIAVSDNGIGFEAAYSEKIFELFQRLHGRSEYKGTGIGLAIVKKIVENHHGFISAKSVVNEGATFDVYLPVIAA